MRTGLLYLLILLFPALAFSGQAEQSESNHVELNGSHADYCYKPGKPLLFAKRYHKERYKEDVREYQRCVKSFNLFQENLAKMQNESARNAQKILDKFVKQQH